MFTSTLESYKHKYSIFLPLKTFYIEYYYHIRFTYLSITEEPKKKLHLSPSACAWINLQQLDSTLDELHGQLLYLIQQIRSNTILVSIINAINQRSTNVPLRTLLARYVKSKFLDSGGSMAAMIKLKLIDEKEPPEWSMQFNLTKHMEISQIQTQ